MVKISDTSRVGLHPPPSPSKYDIIPIHTSDRNSFKFCRRQWAYGSPARLNLVPKSNVHGIREYLWFGTGIHHALERYYNPLLKEDPVASWIEWFELQWNGGLVKKSELDEFVDRNPQPHPTIPNTFVVDGLSEVLPDPDPEVYAAHKELGIGMMQFYLEYAPREDNFAVIMVEHDFSVPIYMPGTNDPMMWVDHRTMPDEWQPATGAPIQHYGPEVYDQTNPTYGYIKPVHARGRMDLIIQDLDSGQYGIIDHKTAATIGDDYFDHLDLDDQMTTYAWAAELEAELHDLEYKQIDFIIYQALRKAFPSPPTMLKSGLPSIDRQKESTTPAMFEKFIKDNGLEVIFHGAGSKSESLQNYYAYLLTMGDKTFIQRQVVRRNKYQKQALSSRIYYEAVDMLTVGENPGMQYPSPSKDYGCTRCIFRSPCVAQEQGYDYESMIADGYVSNHDR